MLSAEQVESYRRDGYVVVPDFVSSSACDALRRRATEIVDDWRPTEELTAFHTDQDDRNSNREFLSSGGAVWCFFEEEAFDDQGQLRQQKSLSINKLGHAMHDLDPEFERFTYTRDLAEVATDIGLSDPLVLQSMYIFKQPGIGGEVISHQDATFLYTEPITVTGFWFAIEEATLENGCLWVAPGQHRTGLRQLFKRAGALGDDDGTEFETLDPTPLPQPPDGFVPLEAAAGTMVILDGQLPHWSDANRSPSSRHAYTVHCISEGADYPAWNWLQRSMPLRRLDVVAA